MYSTTSPADLLFSMCSTVYAKPATGPCYEEIRAGRVVTLYYVPPCIQRIPEQKAVGPYYEEIRTVSVVILACTIMQAPDETRAESSRTML